MKNRPLDRLASCGNIGRKLGLPKSGTFRHIAWFVYLSQRSSHNMRAHAGPPLVRGVKTLTGGG